jgi:phosphatidylglycerophosphate synthase
MKLGLTANQTTGLSLLVLLLGCACLAVGSYPAVIAGTVFVNLWLVLDFVDGNIARYERSSSHYGEFIDAMGAFTAHTAFFAAGAGFYIARDSLIYAKFSFTADYAFLVFLAGSIASLTAIWIRLLYQKFKNTFPDSDIEKHDALIDGEATSSFRTILRIGHNLINLSGLLLPVFFLAALFRVLDVFLFAVAAANSLILVITTIRLLKRGARADCAMSG